MQYAVTLPQHVPDGSFEPAALRDYLDRAEELGFESVWITEQVLGRIPHPSLDQLSRGRLEVGVGMGGRNRPFGAFAVDPDDGLLARFVEGLEVMKALWTQSDATLDGRFWQLDHAPMEPKPFQKPYPPLWFGGSHPTALRRAVTLGDGFFGAGSTTTASFAEQVGIVRSIVAATGRERPLRSPSASTSPSTTTPRRQRNAWPTPSSPSTASSAAPFCRSP
jgi:alkanesulfonate monooxygenase SsuD/methylene tetrahydromethanopterin reductase-like flavin-dependent oxidoreductase (luciferase family)